MRTCRECDCTDVRACVLVERMGESIDDARAVSTCTWVEDDLCSACAETTQVLWVRPFAPGLPPAPAELEEPEPLGSR